MRGLSSTRIQRIKTDHPLRPSQAVAGGPTFSNAFWCNPTFLSVLSKTMQMHHFSYISALFSPFRASQNGQFLRFWVPIIFQPIHLRLVCTLIIDELLSNVNSPAPIKSPRARSLAEPRPQTMWDKSLHARTYNVYHYRPCACNTCFIAIQLFNATAAALNCISQICCYLEHFHIQGLRGLPRWVQYSAFLQNCQYMVLFSTF